MIVESGLLDQILVSSNNLSSPLNDALFPGLHHDVGRPMMLDGQLGRPGWGSMIGESVPTKSR